MRKPSLKASQPGCTAWVAGLCVLASIPDTAWAEGTKPARVAAAITVAEPEGFSALTGEQRTMADVYFGGRLVGSVEVGFRPGSLTITDPGALATMVPGLTDPGSVRAALADSSLSTNAHLVCTPGADPGICGRLAPEVAGVIFDERRFRLSLFVNPALLAARDPVERRYIAAAEPGLGIVNSLAAAVSGSSAGDESFNLQDRLVIGDADRRLRADIGYATGFGTVADRLAVEIDRPDWRYTAGLFWTPGSDLAGRRKLIGAGIETQIDTRLDKDQVRGSSLTVFLNQRARVDILREGRLLVSRIYPAGNQALDTTMLPDGAYEVEIRVEEIGGSSSSERRFFTRNPVIPAAGERVLYAYAGLLADDTASGFIDPTNDLFVQVGAAKRLGPNFALDGSAMLAGDQGIAQLGGYYLNDRFQFRVAAIGLTGGSYGGLVRLASNANSRFNFDFDLRHIEVGNTAAAATPGTAGPSSFTSTGYSALSLASSSYTQFNGSLSYSFDNGRLGVAGSWRRTEGLEREYAIGPSARVDLVRRGPWRLIANADLTLTNRGRSGYVGLGIQFFGQRGSLNGNAGMRTSNLEGSGARRRGAVGSINGSWQAGSPEGIELSLGAGYESELQHDLATASAQLRMQPVELRGDLVHQFGGTGESTQYGFGLETTMAIRDGKVEFEGRDQSDSLAIVDLAGADPDMEFEILINESPAGRVRGGDRMPVALTPYREYDARIRQLSGKLAQYDTDTRRIALYPGNVARLKWDAAELLAVFGRLVGADGNPISDAAIESAGGIGQTDANGYFQIQATAVASISARLPGGNQCQAPLPALRAENGYVRAGTLTCTATPPGEVLRSSTIASSSIERSP
jgi:hypothetical protein